MFMLLLLSTLNFSSAHQGFKSVQCSNAQGHFQATRNKTDSYDLRWRVAKSAEQKTSLKKIDINDFFDPKLKQVFDVYSGGTDDLRFKVMRPETKGKVTSVTAEVTLKAPEKNLSFLECDLKL